MTPKAKAELESQIHTLTSGESIDFSFLSADLQKQVLQQARKKQFRQLIRESNSSLFSRLGALLQAEETPRQDTVRAYFSLERFAATTKAILDSFDDGGIGVSAAETTDEQQREIATTVQDSFATLENIRLLFKG
jgi:hypothetical protein